MTVKRGDMLDQEVKRTKSVPAPWQYTMGNAWAKGTDGNMSYKKEF